MPVSNKNVGNITLTCREVTVAISGLDNCCSGRVLAQSVTLTFDFVRGKKVMR